MGTTPPVPPRFNDSNPFFEENAQGQVPPTGDTHSSSTPGQLIFGEAVTGSGNPYASKVQVPKLQGYSATSIESWFLRLDAYFRIQGLGKLNQDQRDLTKFNITVMYMDEKLHEQAYDVVKFPPETKRYETLKETILARFSATPAARLEQLTSGIQLGDSKPSHLLTQLQRTNATSDKQLIRDLWLQRLPATARAVVAGIAKSNPAMPLEQLASTADEIIDTVRCGSAEPVSITAVAQPGSSQQTSEPLSSLQAVAASIASPLESLANELRKSLARIEAKLASTSDGRGRSQQRYQRGRSSTPHRSQSRGNASGVCWYHRTFKDRATKCEQPCTYAAQSPKN